MNKRRIVAAIGTTAVVAAWWHGHRWRRLQRETPGVVSEHGCVRGDMSDVLCVYMGGAFSRASAQAAPVLGALATFGDVITSEYNLEFYTDEREYDALLGEVLVRLSTGRYRTVIVAGYSVGAKDALRLLLDLWRRKVNAAPLLIDPALTPGCMKSVDRVAASIASRTHPGPIWNVLLQPLIGKLIKGRPEDTWQKGQKPEVLRNLTDMRATKASAYFRFGKKMITPPQYGAECFVDRPVRVLLSEKDPTLVSGGVWKGIEEMFLLADLKPTVVLGGQHGDFLEQPNLWSDHVRREVAEMVK